MDLTAIQYRVFFPTWGHYSITDTGGYLFGVEKAIVKTISDKKRGGVHSSSEEPEESAEGIIMLEIPEERLDAMGDVNCGEEREGILVAEP